MRHDFTRCNLSQCATNTNNEIDNNLQKRSLYVVDRPRVGQSLLFSVDFNLDGTLMYRGILTCSGPQVAAASFWMTVWREEHVVPAEASRSGRTDTRNGPRVRGSTLTTPAKCVLVAPAPSPPRRNTATTRRSDTPIHLQSPFPLSVYLNDDQGSDDDDDVDVDDDDGDDDDDNDVSSFFPERRSRNTLRLPVEGKRERQKEKKKKR